MIVPSAKHLPAAPAVNGTYHGNERKGAHTYTSRWHDRGAEVIIVETHSDGTLPLRGGGGASVRVRHTGAT